MHARRERYRREHLGQRGKRLLPDEALTAQQRKQRVYQRAYYLRASWPSTIGRDPAWPNWPLLPGSGFTVEPGLYWAGRFGVRVEVSAILQPDGVHLTTERQGDLTCLAISS